MPLHGLLDVPTALTSAPTIKGLEPVAWQLPQVDLVQISYEVDEAEALSVTPPALHPSIPPYATFSAAHVPTSPHGSFNLAMVRLVVRAGIRPRALLLGAWVDQPAVAEDLAEGWGYAVTVADVAFQRRYGSIRGTVTIDGATALDLSLEDPEPVAPGDLELFDNLHLVNVADSDPVIIQVDPTYEYHSADRGRAELATFEPERLGIAGIVPVYRVVGVACRADLELSAPRFVMDPVIPAVQSTRRLDGR